MISNKKLKSWAQIIANNKLVVIFFFIFVIGISLVSICNFNTKDINLSGAGTLVNPYKISSASDLVYISELVNSGYSFENEYLEQSADIDLGGIDEFNPIGSINNPFLGTYDGDGHAILNLNIHADESALFLYLGGTVKNLLIKSGKIYGDYAASFALVASGPAKLVNCYNFADIYGNKRAGGLADNFTNGRIFFCKNYGKLFGDDVATCISYNAEEIISFDESDDKNLPSTFSGYIYTIGGDYRYKNKIVNSYLALSSTRYNSYNVVDISKSSISFLPMRYRYTNRILGMAGEGTKNNPYIIKNEDDYLVFTDLVNCGIDFYENYISQVSDIDLLDIENVIPIGIYKSDHYFWGTYNGNGHKIFNIKMDRNDSCGVFGLLAGTVINLKLCDGVIRGDCVGSIASHGHPNAHPQIINCYSEITLRGATRAGGIADNFWGGDIVLCVSDTSLSGHSTSDICSYDAAYIIDSYSIKTNNIDNLLNNDTFTGKIEIDELDNKSITDSINEYISKHSNVRYVDNTRLCIWKNNTLTTKVYRKKNNYIFFIVVLLLVSIVIIKKRTSIINAICIYKLRILNDCKLHRIDLFWYTCFLLSISSFIFLNIIYHGRGFERLFFNVYTDAFSDRTAMVVYASEMGSERYSLSESFYPPLNNFLYLIPSFMYGGYLNKRFAYLQTNIEKDNQMVMLMTMFSIFVIILLFKLFSRYIKGTKFAKNIFPLLLLLTAPMLFAIERGNSIVLALMFTFIFITFYNSENKYLREISLLGLAFATSIKIYPILFCGLLLSVSDVKKSINRIVRVCIYVSVISMITLIPYGGVTTIFTIIENVIGLQNGTLKFSSDANLNFFREFSVNFYNFFRLFFDKQDATVINWYISIFSLLIAIVIILGNREEYKKSVIIACLICGIPSLSGFYTMIFFIIPVLQIYNKTRMRKIDYTYAVIILSMILPLPYYFIKNDFRLYSVISPVGMMVLMILLLAEETCCSTRSFNYNKTDGICDDEVSGQLVKKH